MTLEKPFTTPKGFQIHIYSSMKQRGTRIHLIFRDMSNHNNILNLNLYSSSFEMTLRALLFSSLILRRFHLDHNTIYLPKIYHMSQDLLIEIRSLDFDRNLDFPCVL